jgi:hypothetical protein
LATGFNNLYDAHVVIRPPDFERLTAGFSVSLGKKTALEEGDMFSQTQSRIDIVWCRLMHESIMWPMYGSYECRACGRRYPAFAEAPTAGGPERTASSSALPLSPKAPPATAW